MTACPSTLDDMTVTTAIISAAVSLITAVITVLTTAHLQQKRLLAETRSQTDRLAAEASRQRDQLIAEAANQRERLATELTNRLHSDLRTEFMAEQAIRKLLEHKDWERRSFAEIEKHIGGFKEDELRQLLVRSGAVRFSKSEQGREMWGLLSRNSKAV